MVKKAKAVSILMDPALATAVAKDVAKDILCVHA